MKYIIANWKANKTYEEAKEWLETFLKNDFDGIDTNAQIIICPPFPFIPLVHEKIQPYLFIKVGSQDISQYEEGKFTGEVAARSLSEIATHAIVGHSKRREFLNETEEIIEKKIGQARNQNIAPILCLRNAQDRMYQSVEFAVFEPTEAISSGTGYGENVDIKDIIRMKQIFGVTSQKFIYGGSVNEENAKVYLQNDALDGVLIGGASLNPERFYTIINSALT